MVQPPCYDEFTKEDCPNRSVTCRRDCTAWKEYEIAKKAEYHERACSPSTNTYAKGLKIANACRRKIAMNRIKR